MSTENKTISIRIPEDLLALIDRQAEAEHRTRSNYIVAVLRERLEAELD